MKLNEQVGIVKLKLYYALDPRRFERSDVDFPLALAGPGKEPAKETAKATAAPSATAGRRLQGSFIESPDANSKS